MKRRTALKLITLATLAPKLKVLEAACPMELRQVVTSDAAYKLRFFSAEEDKLLDQLMEMILPADAHSPGAHAAKTSHFVDLMVATSEADALKMLWRGGLQAINAEAGHSTLAAALEKAARNEENPATELERFFVALKGMTIDAYYTSEIGIQQDLEYVGNTYLAEFPGCTHPEHQ